MQDARYSIGWFVWPKDDVLIQGPAQKYPPTTMKEFMKASAYLCLSLAFRHCTFSCFSWGSDVMQPARQLCKSVKEAQAR